jgi:3-oxoacyl-[acyl-carrier protein] reductase
MTDENAVPNKVALVTGASRGLGRRIAEGFIDDGWVVVGAARSPTESWELGASEQFQPRVCDVTDESMVKRLFSEVRKGHGRLDALVNNAGAFSSDLLLSASADRYQSVLHANLVSAHVVTREAVKLMRPKGSGRVVSISSIAAAVPATGNALYATSKIALQALMGGFAVEFRGSGITFNSVAVSFLEGTGMVDALRPEARANYEGRLLAPHPLRIDEIMHAVRFLTSDDAASITGQTIALGSPF